MLLACLYGLNVSEWSPVYLRVWLLLLQGDISPKSTLGRFMAMFFICFAIIFVPKQTNELIEKMNRSSVWARDNYKPRGNTKHVLICGDLKSTSLFEFFAELFHEDHENMNLHAVILQPGRMVRCMYGFGNCCIE